MLHITLFVFIANALTFLLIALLGHFFAPLSEIPVSDYLFYSCIILWGIAKLVWDGGHGSTKYSYDPKERKIMAMVKGFDFDADRVKQRAANTHFGMKMFIAGILPLVGCLVLSFL
ncbi:hypothetical protein L4D76_24695 [Photobacterium sagamiensis]|uniref:hypothetical protein n=1 Tax=Photobacterium sagamiensis TaxID=2910241 RepID=UPI003D135CA7